MKTNILVIGSGISGLTYAIKVAALNPQLNLVIISKNNLLESNTKYAQGGIAVVSNFQKDSFDKHFQDTLTAGAGTCDEAVVRFVVEEGHERLNELIEWGAQFDTQSNSNGLHLTREGGHSEKRIVHHKDKTGLEIQKSLIKKIKTFSNISLLENHTLVDLITDHHTGTDYKRCYGAYVISNVKQEIIKISAQITVLSTGGAGQLFSHTTNPKNATGDGLGAAYRAKVFMEGLPFVQFHPTALYPKINGNTFLISEAVRGEGGILKTLSGDEFMLEYHEKADLAPRDIVARSIAEVMNESQDPHVLLDCSTISEDDFQNQFPTIMENCQKIGINPPQNAIPVIPAAHYYCGGIHVNHQGESQLKGLYAIGECSHTGLHGANRLASNSLLESLVFSHRAALDSLKQIARSLPPKEFYNTIPYWEGEHQISDQKISSIGKMKKQLQKLMSSKVGIFKTSQGLTEAEFELKSIFLETRDIYQQNKLTLGICELRNMVSVAYLMIKQSQDLKKNKGVFYNHDYVE
ncbi:MAG: L-aspartate oxidase [Flavobacteriaceae bacterium]|nr:L-aspartate oxidase [Flavobacteriaceae bacterium]